VSAEAFIDWWNTHSDEMFEDAIAKAAWNAATELVEEKFTSTNEGIPKTPVNCCDCPLICICGHDIYRGDTNCISALKQIKTIAKPVKM
jgi:hypothetical protein